MSNSFYKRILVFVLCAVYTPLTAEINLNLGFGLPVGGPSGNSSSSAIVTTSSKGTNRSEGSLPLPSGIALSGSLEAGVPLFGACLFGIGAEYQSLESLSLSGDFNVSSASDLVAGYTYAKWYPFGIASVQTRIGLMRKLGPYICWELGLHNIKLGIDMGFEDFQVHEIIDSFNGVKRTYSYSSYISYHLTYGIPLKKTGSEPCNLFSDVAFGSYFMVFGYGFLLPVAILIGTSIYIAEGPPR